MYSSYFPLTLPSSHKVAILLPVLSNNFKSLPACFATFIAIFHPPGPCRPPPLGSFLLNFLKLFWIKSYKNVIEKTSVTY